MATTSNVPKSNQISTKFVLGLAGWVIIATAVIAGADSTSATSTAPTSRPRPTPPFRTRSRPSSPRRSSLKRQNSPGRNPRHSCTHCGPYPEYPKPAPANQSTCRQAIAQTWPANLRQLAILTMSQENGQERPDRVSGLNSNGSRDYGCFQLNDQAHPLFFATQDWSNPIANARYGYSIFASRGDWSAWYAVCTPDRVPKYPGIWCGS